MVERLFEIVEKIRKPLLLEVKIGYTNRAASGGLDRYIQLWVEKGRESGPTPSGRVALKELIETFADYRSLSRREREKRIKKALLIVAGLEKEIKARSLNLRRQVVSALRKIGQAGSGNRYSIWRGWDLNGPRFYPAWA